MVVTYFGVAFVLFLVLLLVPAVIVACGMSVRLVLDVGTEKIFEAGRKRNRTFRQDDIELFLQVYDSH